MRTGLIAIVIVWALASPAVAAWDDFFFDAGIGAAFYHPMVYDGTWKQDGTAPSNFRLADLAWKVGIGYRITPEWSVAAHYINLGASGVKARAVSDEDYDPVNHVCLRHCESASFFRVRDEMQGFDVTVKRLFWEPGGWQPFAKAGVAFVWHRLFLSGGNTLPLDPSYNGLIPMAVVGGGMQRGRYYADVSLYAGTLSMNGGCIGGADDCGFPITKRIVLVTVGAEF